MLTSSWNISITYLLTEDSINILILPILHVETVPKEQYGLSAGCSTAPGPESRNLPQQILPPVEHSQRECGQWERSPQWPEDGHPRFCSGNCLGQGHGVVHALGRPCFWSPTSALIRQLFVVFCFSCHLPLYPPVLLNLLHKMIVQKHWILLI